MFSWKSFRAPLTVVVLLGAFFVCPAQADPIVTYTWTTTSQGFGSHLSQPTVASFDVSLSVVQTGKISMNDVTNIQLAYPGLSFDGLTVSSGGNDNAAFVDPVTGALLYNDNQQGFSIFGYTGSIFDYTSFLSVTFDSLLDQSAPTTVKDGFNAIKDGDAYAGYPTAGFWTASFSATDPVGDVPEPASLALMGLGMMGIIALRRRKL